MALVFAVIGVEQYLTRNIYWNPKVKVDNAYAPVGWFYRVNSVFYDPSIYGRFLVVGDPREPRARPLRARGMRRGPPPARRGRDLVGLAALVLAVELRRARGRDRRRARSCSGAGAAILPLALAAAALAARHARRPAAPPPHPRQGRALARDRRPLDARLERRASSSSHHPLIGVGTGGFVAAYAKADRIKGKEPKRASHDAPITVAAETGVAGLGAALLARSSPASSLPFRAQPRRDADRPRPSRLRTSLARDRRAQPLLQRADRGPALLGGCSPCRPSRCGSRSRA